MNAKKIALAVLVSPLLVLFLPGVAGGTQDKGQDKGQKPAAEKPAQAVPAAAAQPAVVIEVQKPSYPLATCLISGKKLGEGAVDHVSGTRLVRFCCKDCIAEFQKDPAASLAKIDKAVIETQKAAYPLDACPISGEKLEADAVDHVSGTRLVRFCCKNCIKDFQKDSAPAMAKIDAALIQKQKASYAPKTCPISGEALGSMGEPVDYLYGTRLVRFCCKNCIKDFKKDPSAALAKLDAAGKK